ncbi:hypothetical protein ASE74_04555 [Pedobacter sp. Leaf216]|uniref:helix-turn-helix domain-containing protein n=1 Tax=Pedobacter sp. Leaf216 TaxID=1735684 RepID=UPI0006F62E32|nr:helix-turn-helix domain-containing protein [Pedobacter sp. Leaf216]KQM69289.1 hypothetical protein ASE74_04555 [Pedobacter sp. Leaf216]
MQVPHLLLANGPLLYYGTLTSVRELDSPLRSRIPLHFLPIPFFWIAFAVLLSRPDLREFFKWKYYTVLGIGQALSLLGYGAWTVYATGSKNLVAQLGDKTKLINVASILILFMASFGVAVMFSRVFPHKSMPPTIGLYIIYGFLLCAQLSVAKYLYRRTKAVSILKSGSTHEIITHKPEPAYEKSGIPTALLAQYNLRLQKMISENQIHLDSSISIDKVANLLGISAHYTSQLFSRIHNESFINFINRLRIDHACSLLTNSKDKTIDEIIFMCGFGSKATFNRVFKNLKGSTPSQFRDRSNATKL